MSQVLNVVPLLPLVWVDLGLSASFPTSYLLSGCEMQGQEATPFHLKKAMDLIHAQEDWIIRLVCISKGQ